MKKKVTKVLNIVVDIIVVLILISSVFILAISLTAGGDGVPNVFGKAYFNVLSESMEPTFNKNDMIICDIVEDHFAEYKVGDVVTFKQDIDGLSQMNTHRIIDIVNSDGKPFNDKKDKTKFYRTKGDHNSVADAELKDSTDILAVYTGSKIPFVGYLRTQEGFFFFILLPMIIFFLYEGVRVIINIVAYNKEKALLAAQEVINSSDLTEEQKKKAIEEYLAAQSNRGSPDEEAEPQDDGEALPEPEKAEDEPQE